MGPRKGDPKCASSYNKFNKEQNNMGKVKITRVKKGKVKKVIENRMKYSDNESVSRESPDKWKAKKIPSTESVIYVGTTYNTESKNVPLIDLTNKREAFKPLYFNNRNFPRRLKSRKALETTSLINLTRVRKIAPKKCNSTSTLTKPNHKLDVLDIPSRFLSSEDLIFNYDSNFWNKCNLTDSDNDFIKWFVQKESESIDLNRNVMPTVPYNNSPIRSDISIERLMDIYQVSSNDSFN